MLRITLLDLTVRLSDYVSHTARFLRDRAAEPQRRGNPLLETLASTRLRAKHSLDALAHFIGGTPDGKRQLRFDALGQVLSKFEMRSKVRDASRSYFEFILESDREVQKAIEQHRKAEPDLDEALGQLLTIISMMRRACSYVLDAKLETG